MSEEQKTEDIEVEGEDEQPIDVLDEQPLTIKRGAEIIAEQSDLIKEAGWKPWRDMIGSYVERFVDGAKGMADGFAGKKKRGE